jgi:hypothetical protein
LQVKRLAGSQRAEIDPNPLNKVLLRVARILIYIDGLLFEHQTVPKPLLSPSSIFPTFNCTKRLAGSPKGWSDQHLTPAKCYSKVAHAFLYTWMDFFQSRKLCPKPLLSYLLPYSRTFNCTSKTTGWFTKDWNWSNHAVTVVQV